MGLVWTEVALPSIRFSVSLDERRREWEDQVSRQLSLREMQGSCLSFPAQGFSRSVFTRFSFEVEVLQSHLWLWGMIDGVSRTWVFMLFKVVDYYLCVVFFLKHPHMLVSVDPLLVRIQFACGCQSYPFKADYTGHVFFSHARILIKFCMRFLLLPLQITTNQVGWNHRNVLFNHPGG